MDRPKAIENFTRVTSIIQTEQPTQTELPRLIDALLVNVEVIQRTNKKSECADCRVRRLCNRDLAVPIITECEVCNKEIVFMVPVASQDAGHWDHPVSRISNLCPKAVRKKHFAKCPVCLKYPGKAEMLQKILDKYGKNRTYS